MLLLVEVGVNQINNINAATYGSNDTNPAVFLLRLLML
jgi:hypothetical protein